MGLSSRLGGKLGAVLAGAALVCGVAGAATAASAATSAPAASVHATAHAATLHQAVTGASAQTASHAAPPITQSLIQLSRYAVIATSAQTVATNTMSEHALAAQANAPPPPCAAGYGHIYSSWAGGYLQGNGVNNPILLGVGNCWTAVDRFVSPTGGYGYEYQNGYGNCMWANGALLELASGGCVNAHPNEMMYADGTNGSHGYYVAVDNADNYEWYTSPCNESGEMKLTGGSVSCGNFQFPGV